MHEGGFGVERIADGAIQFTLPDGRIIAEHPRLPDARTIDGLRNSIPGARGQPIDAADWIIPEGVLNLDLAVSGLMRPPPDLPRSIAPVEGRFQVLDNLCN